MATPPVTESTQVLGRSEHRGLPFAAVVGLLVGVLLFASSRIPLQDVDLYWHILAGRQILSGTPLESVGDSWSTGFASADWLTTQWLSEALLAELHAAGGWSALVCFRAVTVALTLVILARAALRPRFMPLASLPFLIAAAATVVASQERSQQVTYIGAAWLGSVLLNALTEARLPRWWGVVLITAGWSNLHGGWVLVPAVFGLIAASRMLDPHGRGARARPSLGLLCVSLLAGSLSPAGLKGVLSVTRFSAAAEGIVEWGRVTPTEGLGLLWLAMMAVFICSWARRGASWSHVFVVGAIAVFALTAWRNLVPGLLLIAPLGAQQVSAAWPRFATGSEPRWSVPVGAGLAALGLAIGLLAIPGRPHLPTQEYPISLARAIGEMPAGQRVLNDYNVAGQVLFFGGPGTRVAIDGRSDAYGSESIRAHADLLGLRGDWRERLSEIAPTVVLIKEDEPLVEVLREQRGWSVAGSDAGYVLLTPPASAP